MPRLLNLVVIGFHFVLPIAPVSAFAPAPVEDSPTLKQRLQALDELRNGANTPFEEVERQGEKLLAKYKNPEDRAKIYLQLAHVYGQSGIDQHADQVTKYARLALEAERDPTRRARLYTYLGCSAEVAKDEKPWAEKRRTAALAYLTGYKETLALHLPAVAPELPGINKYHIESDDPKVVKEAQDAHAAQVKAREEAEITRELVEHRDILLRQVLELYRRAPAANDELRELADEVLKDRKAVEKLMGKLGDK